MVCYDKTSTSSTTVVFTAVVTLRLQMSLICLTFTFSNHDQVTGWKRSVAVRVRILGRDVCRSKAIQVINSYVLGPWCIIILAGKEIGLQVGSKRVNFSAIILTTVTHCAGLAAQVWKIIGLVLWNSVTIKSICYLVLGMAWKLL